MSVKDSIIQKGFLCTVGLAHLCDQVMDEDSVNVTLFLKAGAIPIVRGNMPQSAFNIHSLNLVWGEALNPYDRTRSAGGSSGGDAGLVSSGCVPFALGGDIGGSIRIPCSFCGIYGFKPTSTRCSSHGLTLGLRKRFTLRSYIRSTVGPIALSVEDLISA